MRLIDAEDLKKELLSRDFFPALVKHAIEKSPTIDAVEVVHGWWDDSGRYQFPDGRKAIRCNICGCALSACEYHLLTWNYCPVCGAKMDGERKNDGK